MPLFYPPLRHGRFRLAMGITSRLLHDRYGADFGVTFHRDVVRRVETVMEIDRAVWRDFRDIGLGYPEPFPRATIEPYGHRFVPVLYGCRCIYAEAEEPAVLPRALDPEEIRGLPPWTGARFAAEEAVREVAAQGKKARALYGPPGAAAARMGWNPHYRPLSCMQNLGSVINTAVSVFGEQVLCLYADDPALLRSLYRNVTGLMLLCLQEFPRMDGAPLAHAFVGDCTVAMISPADYAACNLEFDEALASRAREAGASFLVHQDSGATPHLSNYARLGPVQELDFGQDTDFTRAAELFPGASAHCIIFPGWLRSTPAEAVEEEMGRIMRAGLAFPEFTFSLFEVDSGLADCKVFELVETFRRCAERIQTGRTR
jgi:hypothetical protein